MTDLSPRAAVVFLPGSMCNGRLFDPQVQILSQQGIECHIADLTSALTYEELAENILNMAPDKFALVGLSMGGTLALEIIRQAHERVSHLALLNTTAKADRAKQTRLEHIKRAKAGGLATLMQENYFPRYLSPASNAAEILPIVARMASELGPEIFEQQSRAMMSRSSMEPVLETIECPTLILAGQDDIICPVALHQDMADKIPRAEFKILADCGHIATLERPELVNEALLRLLETGGSSL